MDKLTDEVAALVRASSKQLNYIVAVARGGLIPARLLSSRLNVSRMATIGITYRDRERSDREFYSFPSPITSDDAILLVEDVLETGRSLADARAKLESEGADVATAAFYYQPRSIVVPDFSLGVREVIPRFPWEE